jgi:hypothetical protein
MSSENRYRTRFVWVDIGSRTFHWSKKEGRDGPHKQISLDDVSIITIGRPKRVGRNAEDAPARCFSLELSGSSEGIDVMVRAAFAAFSSPS